MTTCFSFYWDTPAVNPAFLKHSICWVFLSAHPICRFPGSCKHTTHCLNNLLYTHANRRATQTGAQRKRFCLLRGDASKLQTAINMHLHTRAPSRTHTNKLSSLLSKPTPNQPFTNFGNIHVWTLIEGLFSSPWVGKISQTNKNISLSTSKFWLSEKSYSQAFHRTAEACVFVCVCVWFIPVCGWLSGHRDNSSFHMWWSAWEAGRPACLFA